MFVRLVWMHRLESFSRCISLDPPNLNIPRIENQKTGEGEQESCRLPNLAAVSGSRDWRDCWLLIRNKASGRTTHFMYSFERRAFAIVWRKTQMCRSPSRNCLGISATDRCCHLSPKRADRMTEPDILNRKICELRDWQAIAWRRVADPLLTAFERREIRNHIKESDEELRRYLAMMSERLRFQAAQ